MRKSYKVASVSMSICAILAALLVIACGSGGPSGAAPTASDVRVTKDGHHLNFEVGDELCGEYTYEDADDDAEGLSTFRWYRNGTVIPDATDPCYTLLPGDIRQSFEFAVTPAAATGIASGNAVLSPEFSRDLLYVDWAFAQSVQYGPILYLHSSEPFLPSSVEWYIPQTELVGSNGGLDCGTASCEYFTLAQDGDASQTLLDRLVSKVRTWSNYTLEWSGQLPAGHSDPIADLTFMVYTDGQSVPGAVDPVWTETHRNISVNTSGMYSVRLGTINSLEVVAEKLQVETLFLSVQVNGSEQVELLDLLMASIDPPQSSSHWLQTTDATNPGHLADAKSYVHVLQPPDVPGVVDLQYWLFYPFNGPGRARVQFGEIHDETSSLAPLGEHYGDWEVVILRFDDTTDELLGAFMSAHGDYTWYPKQQLLFEDGHILAFASLNGHAIYNSGVPGAHDQRVVHEYIGVRNVCLGIEIMNHCVGGRTDVGLGTFDVDLLNTTDYGQRFDLFDNFEVVAVQGIPLPGEEWVDLDMRWGQERAGSDTDLTHGQAAEIFQDQTGIIGIMTGAGAVAACAIPPFNLVLCPVYLTTVVPAMALAITTGFGVEIVNLIVNESFNGPKSPGAKGDEYFYSSCPTEHKAAVICP